MSTPLRLQSAVTTICERPGIGVLIASGPTVPSDGDDGYAPGCIFIHDDGASANAVLYANTGSKTSAAFKHIAPITAQSAMTDALTTLTPADAEGTPDYAIAAITNTSPYGFASAQEAITVLYVIANLQTRVNELEAALQASGQLPA